MIANLVPNQDEQTPLGGGSITSELPYSQRASNQPIPPPFLAECKNEFRHTSTNPPLSVHNRGIAQTPSDKKGGDMLAQTMQCPIRARIEIKKTECVSSSQGGESSVVRLRNKNGNEYNIPADTKIASTEAQKKRKRNADASKRFRAKRDERNREMKMEIKRLEFQLGECKSDRDRYRNERNESILAHFPITITITEVIFCG
ncbi:hypothetical protein COCC4DRAFT_25296 [Bipolaris maydis ATCC 48331]|uniref:BZIP domain-containing protein n=2 Tax=Cochliobolus heterostrophus TaxID=5016 RepID=M2UFK9_COCH5|nr:uncharacterized protein COCC4DRAFT_25296 [Bipolaris maydis ATCC 48331]EMD86717.1 hypothetical protein COCHEDRAFT_1034489 [Bipolaris maydis C5]ENI03108.1 hypothetical protein COCC4DRAFT_25296 [Bipolaris maydis ATCC 48331]KAJ6267371.1 hypothetical protein PSV08DRAFT_186349 [Bipolaris maydis]KAJ6267674.1 hypothetical protein PSV08DRAFT_186915 [Bipolaris maydis]